MTDAYPIDGSRDALWMSTAVAAPHTNALSEDTVCDVAVIGAGLTGLNAALSLAESGVNVVVLDAGSIGYGASGRSGGQVNLGLNTGPAELLNRLGSAQGERTIELVLRTPQTVFDTVEKYQLDCDAVQQGWVQAAVSARITDVQHKMAEDYNQYAPVFNVLDKHQLTEATGADGYDGGLLCPSAGSVQPLSYTRELARCVIDRGVRIFSNSGVSGISQSGQGWRLETPQAVVTASKVLLCTNGYTHKGTGKPLGNLHKAVVPVRSILVATEPLSDNIRKSVLPGEVTFVDKRRLILYARYDRDGRLCIGDRGPMRDAFSEADFNDVKKRALQVFPQLAGVSWEFHWGGRIAVTKNGLPFMHEVAPGLIAGMGFNGRGVGTGTLMGQELARYALNGDKNALGFPLAAPETFAMHQFHGAGVSMSVKWFALMDYLETKKPTH